MDRIAAKDVSKSANRKWNEIVPRVIRVAKIEENPCIEMFLQNLDDFSDGKY